MKKSMFMLGVAVAALASCTQNEVMEVAEGRAIQFNTFVNNSTKVVIEVPKGELASSEFYVFGNYSTDQDTWTTPGQAYNNETGDTKYYWKASNYYRFGAYANGAGGKIGNATFSAADQKLTFPAYTPEDACDLIACVPAEVGPVSDAASQGAVGLTFKHMLAQVAFEFTTDAADIYELKISNVKINGAISQTEGSINNNGTITWKTDGATKTGYIYEDFKEGVDIANGNLTPTPRTKMQSKLVIPQDLPTTADYITVTFTATLKDGNDTGGTLKSQDFKANLSFTQQTGDGINDPASNKWTAGYRYKYTTKITADMIDDTLTDKEIEFTATVEDWKDASDTTYTPDDAA